MDKSILFLQENPENEMAVVRPLELLVYSLSSCVHCRNHKKAKQQHPGSADEESSTTNNNVSNDEGENQNNGDDTSSSPPPHSVVKLYDGNGDIGYNKK
jgi:hypothetical protein